MFKLFKLFRRSFDLITHTLYESVSMLSTIVFLIVLGTFVMAAVIFSVEAVYIDPMTQVWEYTGTEPCWSRVHRR